MRRWCLACSQPWSTIIRAAEVPREKCETAGLSSEGGRTKGGEGMGVFERVEYSTSTYIMSSAFGTFKK